VDDQAQQILVELVPDRQGEPVQDVELVDLRRRGLGAEDGPGLAPRNDLGQANTMSRTKKTTMSAWTNLRTR
jgi:hypothetical protein